MANVLQYHLRNQHLNRNPLPTAAAVAARFGAIQAQDYANAKWSPGRPGNNISANKRRSGMIRKGQKWLRTALGEAAWLLLGPKTPTWAPSSTGYGLGEALSERPWLWRTLS